MTVKDEEEDTISATLIEELTGRFPKTVISELLSDIFTQEHHELGLIPEHNFLKIKNITIDNDTNEFVFDTEVYQELLN